MPTPVITVGTITESGQVSEHLVVTSTDATAANPITLRDCLPAAVYTDTTTRLAYEDGVYYFIDDHYHTYGTSDSLRADQAGMMSEFHADSDYLTFNKVRRLMSSLDKDGNYAHGFSHPTTALNLGTIGDRGSIVLSLIHI